MNIIYDTEKDDIDIDEHRKEVKIYVTYDNFGGIYKVLTFEQIKKIADEIWDMETM